MDRTIINFLLPVIKKCEHCKSNASAMTDENHVELYKSIGTMKIQKNINSQVITGKLCTGRMEKRPQTTIWILSLDDNNFHGCG